MMVSSCLLTPTAINGTSNQNINNKNSVPNSGYTNERPGKNCVFSDKMGGRGGVVISKSSPSAGVNVNKRINGSHEDSLLSPSKGMLIQPYPQSSSSSTSSASPPPPPCPNTIDSATRIVRLRRIGNSPLGFSIRGGWEHGTGIYISEVHPGSEAQREGLKPGDQILRVNGFIIEQAIHEEVIALIKSSSRITLKVKSMGMIPIKSNRSETLSWKLIDSSKISSPNNHSNGVNLNTIKSNAVNHSNKSSSTTSSNISSLSSDSNSNSSNSPTTNSSNNMGHHPNHNHHHHQLLHRTTHHHSSGPPPPPCPIHSAWSTSSSKSPSSNRSSLSSSRSSEQDQSSCLTDKDLFTSYGMTHGDYMEARVFIRIAPGQGLGCSVVKGPSNYPGIFVQTIKEGGIAQESGLEVGDQIIAMNGISMEPGDIEFNEAIARIKSTSQMTLTVRKKSGLSLFQQQQQQQPQHNSSHHHSHNHHTHHQSSNGDGSSNGHYVHHHSHHHNNPKQRVKAIVHSPPSTTNGTGQISKAAAAAAVAAAAEEIYHSPLSIKHSSESSSSSSFSGPSRFYAPSEHDYSLSEVESNGNDVMKIPIGHESKTLNGKGSPMDKVLLIENGSRVGSSGQQDASATAALIYDKVRREEERLAEEKKKLESEQKRLQCELEKLEKERKQLENMKPQDDSKSISSSSTISGSGNPSIASSGSTSQLGFLDEIKKLAEKRLNENGLITDTLNKTRNLEKMITTKGPKTLISGQDDENRKRHELLMEEFRAAHSKMFGSGERKLREVKSMGLINGEESKSSNNHNQPRSSINNDQPSQKQLQQQSHSVNGQSTELNNTNNQTNVAINNNVINNNNNTNNKLIKGPIVSSKSIPPPIQQTITNSNGETVTILRTTSPCKKSIPPPIPVKKTTSSPIVTITSYESHSHCKNRFLINNETNGNNDDQFNSTRSPPVLVTVDGKAMGDNIVSGQKVESSNGSSTVNTIKDLPTSTSSSSSGLRPVSIKINLQ